MNRYEQHQENWQLRYRIAELEADRSAAALCIAILSGLSLTIGFIIGHYIL